MTIGTLVYRNELKYYISNSEYYYLKTVLSAILQRDAYGVDHGEYWIRSLYFDTSYGKDYYEKMIGIKERRKIRLRIYDVNTDKVKLEIKNKYDDYMMKEMVTLSKADAEELIKGNIDILLNYDNESAIKAYKFMHLDYYKPSAIIDYEREAYVAPINNIRITFDKNVRTAIESGNMFQENLPMKSVFEEEVIVLEVKYNNSIPKHIRDILGTCIGTRSSVSKYCLGKII